MQEHVIVDGSNIATEGRSQPSLAQLNEAVLAFMKEFPKAKVTVIVDATFGYRIHKKELRDFEEAISNNELVAPPAGAIGRGDAFVLSVAEKVKGAILSNDSYQEFHGKYPWLFTPGRLIGGKPVPHVGWVFVERLPVRGATSRRSVKSGAVVEKAPRKASDAASQPMPVPKSPPPTTRASTPALRAPAPAPKVAANSSRAVNTSRTATPSRAVNEVLPFLTFVEKSPVGTQVKAVVEAYSAHGATVSIGEVRGYVPLRLLASPPPRSARDHLEIGQVVQLVVAGFTPARRSIELGLPDMVAVSAPSTQKTVAKSTSGSKQVAKKSRRVDAAKAAESPKKTSPAKKKAPTKAALAGQKKSPTKQTAKKQGSRQGAPAKSSRKGR
jgi:hypothetical protein